MPPAPVALVSPRPVVERPPEDPLELDALALVALVVTATVTLWVVLLLLEVLGPLTLFVTVLVAVGPPLSAAAEGPVDSGSFVSALQPPSQAKASTAAAPEIIKA